MPRWRQMGLGHIVRYRSPPVSHRSWEANIPDTRRRPSATEAALIALLVIGSLVTAGYAHAQWSRSRTPPRFHPEATADRGFTFCRVMYERVRYEAGGQGWVTDYPYADINFMTRLAELTAADVSFDHAGAPNHYVVRLTDDALFACPFVMASDVGTAGLRPDEVARLREYLLKGGFLWVDDFWGERAWEHWIGEIAKVLSPAEFVIEDVSLDDPLFATHYVVPRVPQITSIQFWRRSGGSTTSERGSESAVPHLRAIRDARGRIMVLMSHNTDIADAWEREGEDYDFFYHFAHVGYALGINVVLHTMTH